MSDVHEGAVTKFPGEDGWSPLEWAIDDRERWERELWIYIDARDEWIRAPKMKVFELGKVGIEYLLRVGCRNEWAWRDWRTDDYRKSSKDEVFCGETPEEVARFACAGMPLPATVLVIEYIGHHYVNPPPLQWLVTIHADRILRTACTFDREADLACTTPLRAGPTHTTMLDELSPVPVQQTLN